MNSLQQQHEVRFADCWTASSRVGLHRCFRSGGTTGRQSRRDFVLLLPPNSIRGKIAEAHANLRVTRCR
jgi:hypothetical protein